MSYEVLARKWRPLSFDDVVGQEHITTVLKKAVSTGRISHAYMFAGPRGCGKTSTARILARVINCDNLKDGNPCNECESCRGVLSGSNLDVMEIDGASHTGVNEVRDLQESIGYSPSQHRNKVYIIDEVHMLSTHAFNALLKTLEEPPRHVYFIFATTAPNKIPDTIKSRCQRHHFKRLEIREIAAQLEAICKAEKVKCDEDGLRLLARKADGSMRDGTSLLDQCITSSDGNVSGEAVRGILGLIDQEKVLEFIGAIASGEPAGVLRLLDAAVSEGLDIQELSGALLEGYRDLMLLATSEDLADLLLMSRDEVDALRAHLERYELADLVTVVDRLCAAAPRLKTAADPRILMESMLVDLTLLERQTDIRDLIARLDGATEGGVVSDAGESRPKTRETKEPPTTARTEESPIASSASVAQEPIETIASRAGKTPPATQASPESPEKPTTQASKGGSPGTGVQSLETLQPLWEGFVAYVRQKKVSLGVCLISGRVYGYDGEHLTLRFQKSFNLQKEQVANEKNLQFLQSTFERYFGQPVKISCFSEGEERAMRFEEAARRQKTPERRYRGVSEEKKPVVKKLMQEFDGEIIRQGR
jgi:DNA polymerase-3 subunit gamma/tau